MRILVVEDDKQLAAGLRRGLEAEGYAVDVALTGTDGEWFAAENTYDALVVDVMLPGVAGDVLCARRREAGDWTPILMLTARSAPSRRPGPSTPGRTTSWRSRSPSWCSPRGCGRWCGAAGESVPAVLTVGDLRLDPATHELWRGEVPVPVTPRQFALLEFLMSRGGEVVPKATILEHVWDFAYEGDPNIVEVYVRQLRLRIDEPFGRRSLQTVRLVGYRLVDDLDGRADEAAEPAGPGRRPWAPWCSRCCSAWARSS